MKYTEINGHKMSAFSLGTVQLGMDYGLGADRQKPSEQTAFSILDTAMQNGIDNLDTANNYGDSEAVIGRWLRKRKTEQKPLPWVVTKIGPLKHGNYDILRDDIMYQTEGCLENLGTDCIDCLMLHNFEDYEKDGDSISKIFDSLKTQGICKTTALSAYSYHDYGVIAQSGFDAVQIPINVFDVAQITGGGLQKIAQSGMMIFARSVFLQGLVFKTPQTLDRRMAFCLEPLTKYIDICSQSGLAPDVLALSFVLSLPGVTCAVMGCDNEKQVRQNCELFDKTVTLTDSQKAIIFDAFGQIDNRVINPGLWFNSK